MRPNEAAYLFFRIRSILRRLNFQISYHLPPGVSLLLIRFFGIPDREDGPFSFLHIRILCLSKFRSRTHLFLLTASARVASSSTTIYHHKSFSLAERIPALDFRFGDGPVVARSISLSAMRDLTPLNAHGTFPSRPAFHRYRFLLEHATSFDGPKPCSLGPPPTAPPHHRRPPVPPSHLLVYRILLWPPPPRVRAPLKFQSRSRISHPTSPPL